MNSQLDILEASARVNLADLCPSSVYEAQLPGKWED